jgi:hypothetical protein
MINPGTNPEKPAIPAIWEEETMDTSRNED